MHFNPEKVTNDICEWITAWFSANGSGCNAVVGISGGKDSSVVAALCARALGKDRVIGVLMPNGVQPDIDDAKAIVDFLGIKHYVLNISEAYKGVLDTLSEQLTPSRQTVINLAPRIRMTTLYALSQSQNGRVANTCNLSEDWVGYSTRYGDSAGDFAPIASLTVTEVRAVGEYLRLPLNLVNKTPSDGLSGKTDEDNLGFTYAALDRYIRTGVCEDAELKARIDRLHAANRFKLEPIPSFHYTTEESL